MISTSGDWGKAKRDKIKLWTTLFQALFWHQKQFTKNDTNFNCFNFVRTRKNYNKVSRFHKKKNINKCVNIRPIHRYWRICRYIFGWQRMELQFKVNVNSPILLENKTKHNFSFHSNRIGNTKLWFEWKISLRVQTRKTKL